LTRVIKAYNSSTVLALFVSLAFIGLVAIDPIGIAAMPILLVQKKPIAKSLSFLGGSFLTLIILGFIISEYLGKDILKIDTAHQWLVPIIELVGGIILS